MCEEKLKQIDNRLWYVRNLKTLYRKSKYHSRLSIPFESPDSPSLTLFFRSLDGEAVEPGSANGGGLGGCDDAGFVDCEPEGDEEWASRWSRAFNAIALNEIEYQKSPSR
jgi:hypothetical protein